MKQELFKQEFNKAFLWFTNESIPSKKLHLELDLYKKLWNFFLAGDSYYFVFNYHTLQCDVVSHEVEAIHGYKPSEFDLMLMSEQIHPDDFPYFLSIGRRIEEFLSQLPIEKIMKYKARYDVRYPKKNGDYVRILFQGINIEHDKKGRLLRSFCIHTDITYLKKEGKPTLSFIGMDGEPSYIDVDVQNNLHNSKDDFTARERDILKLLIEGKLSKQISSILNISKQTVDTHRKNMLHKKHLTNTSELVGKSIMCGWI